MLQIGRSVETNFVIVRERDSHHPPLSAIGPQYFGIAKIRHVKIEDRILSILGPSASAIVAVGKVLSLEGWARCGLGSVCGVDGDETRFRTSAETARVVLIHYSAAGEDHDAVLFRKSDRQFAPVNQIGADGVAPTHVAPASAEWIVLEKQMILALEIDQAVRIVGPVAGRGKMELRAVGLLIGSRLREQGQGCGEKSSGESGRQDLYSLARGAGMGAGDSGLGL